MQVLRQGTPTPPYPLDDTPTMFPARQPQQQNQQLQTAMMRGAQPNMRTGAPRNSFMPPVREESVQGTPLQRRTRGQPQGAEYTSRLEQQRAMISQQTQQDGFRDQHHQQQYRGHGPRHQRAVSDQNMTHSRHMPHPHSTPQLHPRQGTSTAPLQPISNPNHSNHSRTTTNSTPIPSLPKSAPSHQYIQPCFVALSLAKTPFKSEPSLSKDYSCSSCESSVSTSSFSFASSDGQQFDAGAFLSVRSHLPSVERKGRARFGCVVCPKGRGGVYGSREELVQHLEGHSARELRAVGGISPA